MPRASRKNMQIRCKSKLLRLIRLLKPLHGSKLAKLNLMVRTEGLEPSRRHRLGKARLVGILKEHPTLTLKARLVRRVVRFYAKADVSVRWRTSIGDRPAFVR